MLTNFLKFRFCPNDGIILKGRALLYFFIQEAGCMYKGVIFTNIRAGLKLFYDDTWRRRVVWLMTGI